MGQMHGGLHATASPLHSRHDVSHLSHLACVHLLLVQQVHRKLEQHPSDLLGHGGLHDDQDCCIPVRGARGPLRIKADTRDFVIHQLWHLPQRHVPAQANPDLYGR